MTAMTPRERRLVALALLAALLAVLWLGVVEPLAGGYLGRAEARERLLAEIAQDQRLAAGLGAARRQAEAQAREDGAFRLVAPTRALAGEALKERLVAVAGDGKVKSVLLLDPPAAAPEVRVRAAFALSLPQLVGALRRLADEAPYALVETLAVVAEPAGAIGRVESLDVVVVVSAPVAPGEEPRRSPPAAAAGLRDLVRPCRVAARRRGRAAGPGGAAAAGGPGA